MKTKNARIAAVLAVAAALTGCAVVPNSSEGQLAATAAVADGVTTHVAIAAGAVETNPFVTPTPAGLVVLTALKVGFAHKVERLEDPQARRVGHNLMSAGWGGASVNNLLIALGAAPAVAIIGGISAGIALWQESDRRVVASLKQAEAALAQTQAPAEPTLLALAQTQTPPEPTLLALAQPGY